MVDVKNCKNKRTYSPGCAFVKPYSNFCESVGNYVLLDGTQFSNNMFNECMCNCVIQLSMVFTELHFVNSVIYFKFAFMLQNATPVIHWSDLF